MGKVIPLDELNEDQKKFLALANRYKQLIGKSPLDRGMMDLLNECLDKVEKYKSRCKDYEDKINKLEKEMGYYK